MWSIVIVVPEYILKEAGLHLQMCRCIYVVLCQRVIADKVYKCDMLFKQYFQALLPPDRPALDGNVLY